MLGMNFAEHNLRTMKLTKLTQRKKSCKGQHWLDVGLCVMPLPRSEEAFQTQYFACPNF